MKSVGSCALCGKQRYATRKDAREVIRKIFPGSGMTAYRCEEYWHVGRPDEGVKRGRTSRHTIYGKRHGGRA